MAIGSAALSPTANAVVGLVGAVLLAVALLRRAATGTPHAAAV